VDDWGLRDRPLASSVAMTLAAGASWLVAQGTGNLAAGVAIAVVLTIILWRTWLPVRYKLGSGGVTESVLGWGRRTPWGAIQSFEVQESGVMLLADAAPTALAPLRGLVLPWDGRREEVLAIVEFYVPNGNASAGKTAN
jgi:hypothetical protein